MGASKYYKATRADNNGCYAQNSTTNLTDGGLSPNSLWADTACPDSEHENDLVVVGGLGRTDFKVHFKLDTGMGRLGILAADAPRVIREVKRLRHLDCEGIFSHCASILHRTDRHCAAILPCGDCPRVNSSIRAQSADEHAIVA